MTISNQIILNSISPEDLVELFRPMLKEIIRDVLSEKDELLLSPAEACKKFVPCISKTTLAAWTKKGLLNDHRIGGRVYYRLSEILEKSKALKRYKV